MVRRITRRSLAVGSLLLLLVLASGCTGGSRQPTNDMLVTPTFDVGPRDHGLVDRGLDGDARDASDASADALADAGPGEALVDAPRPDLLQPDGPCLDPGVVLAPGVEVWPTNLASGQQATIVYAPPAPLAGGSNLSLHHGFNFWTLDVGGGATASDVAMTPRGDGSFEATITLPAGARLVDFVFFTTASSGDKTWDNNGGADYHRAVSVPYIGPYLTFVDNTTLKGPDRDPAHSITVSFKSDRACHGAVRYGSSPAALNSAVSGSGPAVAHQLRIVGLQPDTVYHYRVECAPAAGACARELSPVYSFRTAEQDPTKVRFLLLADPQDNHTPKERWLDIAAELTTPAHDSARFLVIAGDLAGDDLPQRWWDFFDRGRALLASKPIVPAVGNHDTPTYGSVADTSSFEELFDLDSSSGSDTHYGLVYGSAAFVVLNSETAQSWVSTSDWLPGGAQHDWLAATLPKLSASVWTFAVWHIPPYNAGARHLDQNVSTRGITKLFNGQVDWVLSGHEHLYQRSKPIRHAGEDSAGVIAQAVASYGRGASDGVGYLIAPAAGHDPPEDTLVTTDPTMALLAYPTTSEIDVSGKIVPWVGYVEIEVDGKTLQLRARALGQSQPRDTLTYTRP